MSSSKHKVVIVGSGFGGIRCALDLIDDDRFELTLLTVNTYFQYYPTLYRTATGGKRMISSIPLNEIFAQRPIRIIQDEVIRIDREAKTIITRLGHVVGFQTVIFAIGVKTNYFGIKGLKKLSFNIKTTEGAEELKKHIHQQVTDNKRPDANYVVVGGGPTGIELAGALPSYIKHVLKKHGLERRAVHVELIEAAPRLVPKMPKDFSRRIARHLRHLGVKLYLKTTVQAQTADALMVHDKAIRSHTVIWTAGVANHNFFTKNDFQHSASGKVRVNQYMQAEPNIFVIGDNADTPYSGLAQTALHDARYVANYLKTMMNLGEPEPYKAKRPIYVFPSGSNWAAVLWGKVRIYGILGSWLRSLADLVAYHDFEPWQLATKRWMAVDDQEEKCPVCDNS